MKLEDLQVNSHVAGVEAIGSVNVLHVERGTGGSEGTA